MSKIARKARALRLERLHTMLNERLEHAPTAIEALMSEIAIGESRAADWEALHAAAARDRMEHEVAGAYNRITALRYWKDLSPAGQAEVFMHAADYFQGVLGDREAAEGFLRKVLEQVPTHLEAFTRLQTQYEAAGDKRELAELYSLVAENPPKAAAEVARGALNAIKLLPAKTPLSDGACKRLVALGAASLRLLDAVDTHCRNTRRFELACTVRELALEGGKLTKVGANEQRQALLELRIGEAKNPEKAIVHLEELLRQDPNNAAARSAAERLLSSRSVASRAAAALKEARRLGTSLRPPQKDS